MYTLIVISPHPILQVAENRKLEIRKFCSYCKRAVRKPRYESVFDENVAGKESVRFSSIRWKCERERQLPLENPSVITSNYNNECCGSNVAKDWSAHRQSSHKNDFTRVIDYIGLRNW